MNTRFYRACLGGLMVMTASALAQEPAAVDPEIQKMVAEISPARIEATVRRLVEFRSRIR